MMAKKIIGYVPKYPTGIIWKFASATKDEALHKMRHSTGKPYKLLKAQGYEIISIYVEVTESM